MKLHPPYRYRLLAVLLLVLLGGACQKVVRLDLDGAERRLVIEAMLVEDSVQTINLRRTSDFYQQGQDLVQDALVILEKPGGAFDTLGYDAGGDYRTEGFQPVPYQTYGLRIEDGEDVYSSGIIFPSGALIDTVGYEPDLGNTSLGVAVLFTYDTPGIPNYYRVKYYRNGAGNPRQYNLFSDEDPDKPDGGYLSSLIYLGTGIQSGDTVVMELQSLDEGSYHYFKDLNKALGSSSTLASPFNPVGNVLGTKDAFGYFGGMVVDTVWYIVP